MCRFYRSVTGQQHVMLPEAGKQLLALSCTNHEFVLRARPFLLVQQRRWSNPTRRMPPVLESQKSNASLLALS